jgi:hypothetical protein
MRCERQLGRVKSLGPGSAETFSGSLTNDLRCATFRLADALHSYEPTRRWLGTVKRSSPMLQQQVCFISPQSSWKLPAHFQMREYFDTEQELWALFPEADGKRVNFMQIGLTAWLYVESDRSGELGDDETYVLMPCVDYTMRPLRMVQVRRLSLTEWRMGQLSAIKLIGRVSAAGDVMHEVGHTILGEEIAEEANLRYRGFRD